MADSLRLGGAILKVGDEIPLGEEITSYLRVIREMKSRPHGLLTDQHFTDHIILIFLPSGSHGNLMEFHSLG